jgi:hypothetical protein
MRNNWLILMLLPLLFACNNNGNNETETDVKDVNKETMTNVKVDKETMTNVIDNEDVEEETESLEDILSKLSEEQRNVYNDMMAFIKWYTIRDTFEILLDYKDHYVEYFNGQGGFMGENGYNGYDGYDAGSEGCRGENGGHGEPGMDGYMGFDGPDINVFAEAYYDNILQCDLLKVRVENLMQSFNSFYLVNPAGGNISVTTVGGTGGPGGNGGRGGDGGDGGPGERYIIEVEKYVTETDTSGKEIKKLVVEKVEKRRKGGQGGDGGDGGYGGRGGDGGNGGNIQLFYTVSTQKYLSAIELYTIHGSGGFGGPGGSGGAAGSGGIGEPNGSSGYSGSSGLSGSSGYSGNMGYVTRTLFENKAWE